MAMRIEVNIEVESDFHIGTGSGAGRTIDAVVLKDEQGTPYIPASSLKGLTRWHAEQLVQLHPQLDRVPAPDRAGAFEQVSEQLFGMPGMDAGLVFFTNARYQERTIPEPQVHGRSSRDRTSGRAMEDHLFHVEDAPAGHFEAVVYSQEAISWHATLLLLMALRRIEALGGQRRRGKGQARITCRVVAGEPLVQGLVLPSQDQGRFEALLKCVLSGGPEPSGQRSLATPSVEAAHPRSAATPQAVTSGVVLVFARAQEPLTLTGDPETGNIISSLDFIPGSSVRGALAWHLRRSGLDTNQEPFQAAFVREQICFGPLYPSLQWRQEASFPFPLPRSVLTCKYYPGIWVYRTAHARLHGVRDVLQGDSLEICGYRDVDSQCEAPLVPCGGYVQIVPAGTGLGLQPVQVERFGIQRTEIDDVRLRGQDQRLYTTEALPAGTWFAGYVWGPADLLSALLSTCPISDEPLVLHVGKSRTRGHGTLEVFFRIPERKWHMDYPLVLPQGHSAIVDPDRSEGFTLTLYTDTIGIDALLRPITQVNGATLWGLLGGEGPSPLEVKRGYAGIRQIAGFNSVPGVPRTPDWALVSGSTWHVVWHAHALAAQRSQAVHLLQQAVSAGVGLRRGEGFGRVIVNLPLHGLDLDQPRASSAQLAVKAELGLPSPLLPGGPAPGPSRERPSLRSPLRGLSLDKIGAENRAGLARLLWQMSRYEDAATELETVLAERARRGKAPGGEDVLLHELVVQYRSRGSAAGQQLLQRCAEELSHRDALARRK